MSTVFLLLLSSSTVFSAPISSRDVGEETVHWASGPNTRGTVDLTLSCVLTLVLCLWTSLHLDVPRQGDTIAIHFALKSLWTLCALLAPEFVVTYALMQWIGARNLSREMNEAIGKKTKSDRPKNPWTLTHSFFAGMKGFAIKVDHNDETRFIETDMPGIPLTAKGVLLLAQCGYIPDISETDILDKSKADSLAKSLVCLQLAWCFIQYIGRLASHLPVSLLELNTLGHALCALIIYLSWWYKPLDIKQPYMLYEDLAPPPLVAYMWMSSVTGSLESKTGEGVRPEFENLEWDVGAVHKEPLIDENQRAIATSDEGLLGFRLRSDVNLGRRQTLKEKLRASPNAATEKAALEIRTAELSSVDIRRWRLASDAITQYFEADGMKHSSLMQAHTSGWWLDELLISSDGISPLFVLFTILSVLYGSLHASAWNYFFSSWQERLLWRIASVSIAGIGILASLYVIWDRVSKYWDSWVPGMPYFLRLIFKAIKWGVFAPLLVLAGFAYPLCRLFVVGEAFASLRELPAGVYITPSWSQLIPHL